MSYQLMDRYTKRSGQIIITGVQALVRLMLLQSERDRAAGLHTAGYVSGYRGSPLGTLDMAFAGAAPLPTEAGIVVMPAVNEEMAATAIAGTQQIEQSPAAKYEGVYALWYGKGPGVDRAADAIRHGNAQGTSRLGGVVLAVGDDHSAKSSSLACYTDDTLVSLRTPLLSPSTPEEIVVFGLHAFAASRFSGSWMALKIINEVADSTQSMGTEQLATEFLTPAQAPAVDVYNRWPVTQLQQEAVQLEHRLPAAKAYVRANALDRVELKEENARIGIVAAGKSWLDLQEALRLLGLDRSRLRELGVALYKPAMIWPLEEAGLREFASGLTQIVVVEEKTGLIEGQIKAELFGEMPGLQVHGKKKPDGSAMFPAVSDLTPELIAAKLGEVLFHAVPDVAPKIARVREGLASQAEFTLPPALRKPFFCSGCPHNRSTAVPEGSRATGGIGCHGLAAWHRKDTTTFAQMGGEGVHWVGLAPFTDEQHMFANLGDGTYFHSGILAIRQAVAAKTNITYKILYNSAVAMTGGQSVDGELSVEQLIRQLRAEGVQTVIVSTDDLDRYEPSDPVRKLANRVEHRDDLEALQRELREKPGVSVIVYEQMCATEKRRLRKRGRFAEAPERVFINELVCEGCGDCSVKSNCLSVEPVQTAFGVKRRINQTSCNKDMSCLNGFCPSFVTVKGGAMKKRQAGAVLSNVELPLPPAATPEHQRVLVAGVGGTGVVTIGALLSMAGFMTGEKVGVLDLLGGAQKGGAVTSHIHLGGDDITALRIPAGEADLVLVCDQIVGNMRDVISSIDRDRSYVLINADVAITSDFVQSASAADATLLTRRLQKVAGEKRFDAFPFTRLAEKLLGDGIGSNLMMIGFAFQKGWLAFDLDSFRQAIHLNGVGVKMNLEAFDWGRQLAFNSDAVLRSAGLTGPEPETAAAEIERRAAFLAEYQDRAYADRFLATIETVQAAERKLSGGDELTLNVAKSLFKLMAYKDEYEVARLHRSTAFRDALAAQFEGDFKLNFHMAPPLIAKRDKATGELRKQRFGSWMRPMFGLLEKGKRLRGTPFDVFGYTAERRMERALIAEYEGVLPLLLASLTAENIQTIITTAALPQAIKGYGHIKDKAVEAYHSALAQALQALKNPAAHPTPSIPSSAHAV